MAWIMKKKIKGGVYLYLYESKWVNGKPKNIFIKYLGPARDYNKERLTKIKSRADKKDAGDTPHFPVS